MKYLFMLTIARTTATNINKKSKNAYPAHNTFSIFTACCYFRGDGGEVVSKNIMITCNATDHSRIAAHNCTMKVIEELNKTVENC